MGVVVEDPVFDPVVPVGSGPMDWLPLVLILSSLGGLLVVTGSFLAIRRRKTVSGRPMPAL